MNALQHTLIALSLGVAASTSFAAPLSNGSFANGLTGWNAIGDVAATGAPSALLTTAFADGGDDAVNANASGLSPELANQAQGLEELAGLSIGALDLGGFAFEGSALTQSFFANAGDVLSFNFRFLTNEDTAAAVFNNDGAFVAINGAASLLASAQGASSANGLGAFAFGSNGSFTYTFNQSGTVNLAVGVFDLNDSAVSSGLSISGVNVTPAVPEPSSVALVLAGLLAAGVAQRRARR